jgi:NAD-dependent deacetylase
MPPTGDLIAKAAELLRDARQVTALTGAGLSTQSGIPDFRSPDSGLWAHTDPLEVASLLSFRYHPERFFAWVRPLVSLMLSAQPNAAHRALADLEARGTISTLITQNIDELHQRAGSRRVLEIHGSIETATCVRCHARFPGDTNREAFLRDGSLPHCPDCGGLLKPDVVLLGEQLRASVLQAAHAAARDCDVMLVAGSSLEVLPAGGLPEEALLFGARLIIVNLQPTYLDERADVVIHGDVVEVLPLIAAALGAAPDV